MDQFGYRYSEQQTGYYSAPSPAAPKSSGKGTHVAEGAHKRYLLRSITHGIGTAIMAVAIILAVALVGVRFLGYDVYAVLSGSMEPTYHVGSVIYVKDCEPEEVQIGDPITFVMNEDLVVATHRVVGIDTERGAFYTKGDANEDPDGAPVLYENLLGKPVFSIPYLGYIADYVQEPPGSYVALAVCALVIMLTFIPDLFAKEEDEEENSKKKKKKGKKSQGDDAPDSGMGYGMPASYGQPAYGQPMPYGQAGSYNRPMPYGQAASYSQPARGGVDPCGRPMPQGQMPPYPQYQQNNPYAQPQAPAVSERQPVSVLRMQQPYGAPSAYAQQPMSPQQRQMPVRQSAPAANPYNNPHLQTPARQNPVSRGRHARPVQQDWSRYPMDDAPQGGNPQR